MDNRHTTIVECSKPPKNSPWHLLRKFQIWDNIAEGSYILPTSNMGSNVHLFASGSSNCPKSQTLKKEWKLCQKPNYISKCDPVCICQIVPNHKPYVKNQIHVKNLTIIQYGIQFVFFHRGFVKLSQITNLI